MTFQEALNKLNIEDYSDRIINSSSSGELFYLSQYIHIAEGLKDDTEWFREWFEHVIALAEKHWKRPESVFQHINRILLESMIYEGLNKGNNAINT